MPNNYQYSTNTGTTKGAFNIYQNRDGSIMILMGKRYAELTHSQIQELCIDVYCLFEFDHDAYKKYYKL